MKIVVLDGYTLNPGDLSWASLEDLGDCGIHDRTASDLVIERAADADVALINKVVFTREVINRLPQLKYIGVVATGYNVVDLEAAGQKGIIVTNVPAYATESVAQMVFAHVLNLTQRVAHHSKSVQEGRWSDCEDFCFWEYPLVELSGLTMGIIGLGRIGYSVAKLANAFGMRVIAHDVSELDELPPGVEMCDLEAVFRDADVVSLHCPLTEENRGFVDDGLLRMMKKTAFLVNTGRGPLVDERALALALNEDRIAGAGLDVLEIEPPGNDSPLLSAANCFVTPHISWATRASRQRLMDGAIGNVRAFLDGAPRNVVNAEFIS